MHRAPSPYIRPPLCLRATGFSLPKAVACNNGAGGFKERMSKSKRPLLLRKVKLKIP